MHLEEEGKGKRQFGDGKYEYTIEGKGKCGWPDVIKHLCMLYVLLAHLNLNDQCGPLYPGFIYWPEGICCGIF